MTSISLHVSLFFNTEKILECAIPLLHNVVNAGKTGVREEGGMLESRKNAVSLKKKDRIRLHEASALNDIAFRGPLNYRLFQILGWICIVIAQIIIMISIGSHFGRIGDGMAEAKPFLSTLAELALPFLLVANFTMIMNGQRSFRTLLLKNFFAMAGLYAAYALLLGHFITGVLTLLSDDPSRVTPTIFSVLGHAAENGFYCFNIFVDLFLCTLVMYFLNARPKRFFQEKKILVFRLFTLAPFIYEFICMVVKIRTVSGQLELSPYLYPLLTVKPPMTFLLFVILAVFIKTRELRFRSHGRTREEYQAFLKTNRNSMNFSIFLAVMLVILSAVDFFAVSLFSETGDVAGLRPAYRALGLGDSRWLFLMAPLVLLFSYTREPKKIRWNVAIPLTGFVFIILVYLQGILQILHLVRLPKFRLDNYTPLVVTFLNNIRK